MSRPVGQLRALLGLRFTLWQRRLTREAGWVRVLFQVIAFLFGAAMSASFSAFVLWAASPAALDREALREAGGPVVVLTLGLAFVFAARLYLALLSLTRGSLLLEPRRFLPYAVPPWLITSINLGAQLLEPAWLFFWPPLIALCWAVTRLGGPPLWAGLVVAPLFVLAAASLFQLTESLLRAISGRPALRRLFGLAVSLIAMAIALGFLRRPQLSELGPRLASDVEPTLRWLPPGLAAHLADALGRGDLGSAALQGVLLLAFSGALLLLGHRLALRDARRAPEQVRALPTERGRATGWELPLLPGAFSALFEKELKTLLRAAWRPLLAAPVAFLFLRVSMSRPQGAVTSEPLLFAAAYAHLGVLVYCSNAFGFDLDATRGWFLWPVRGRALFAAKNAVAYCVSLLLFALLVGVQALTARVTFAQVLVGFCAHLATFPLFAAVGNACSVMFPAPNRGTKLANSGGATVARLGVLALVALGAWAPYALAHLLGFPVVAAYLGEAVAMGIAYGGVLAFSESLLEWRKERLLALLRRDE